MSKYPEQLSNLRWTENKSPRSSKVCWKLHEMDAVIHLDEGTIGILVPEGKPTSMAAASAATLAPVDLVLGCGIRFICGIRLICGIRFVSSGRRSLVDTVIRLEEGTIGTIGILVPEGKPTSMAAEWAATLAPVDLVLGCGIRFICGIRLICGIRFVSSGRRSLVDTVIRLEEGTIGTIGILVPEGKPTSMAAASVATLAPVDLVLGCGIRFICGIRLICGIRFVSSGRRSLVDTVICLEEGTIGTIGILVPEGKPTSMAAASVATLAPVDLVLGCGIRFICGIRLICGIRFVSSGRRSLVDTVIRLEEGTIGTIGILVPEGKPTSMAAEWAATLAPVDLVLGCGIRFICGIRLICGIRFVSSGRSSRNEHLVHKAIAGHLEWANQTARKVTRQESVGTKLIVPRDKAFTHGLHHFHLFTVLNGWKV